MPEFKREKALFDNPSSTCGVVEDHGCDGCRGWREACIDNGDYWARWELFGGVTSVEELRGTRDHS